MCHHIVKVFVAFDFEIDKNRKFETVEQLYFIREFLIYKL